MTKFETVRNTLKELIETELPNILQEENKQHNDGLLMETLSGVSYGEVLQLPYVKIGIKSAEHTEKDRIVKNTVYEVELEIVLQKSKDEDILIARYGEAFEVFAEKFATHDGGWELMDVFLLKKTHYYIKIHNFALI